MWDILVSQDTMYKVSAPLFSMLESKSNRSQRIALESD